jgi:pimeloyl-ACP methyl ester carboxylesterase
VAWAATSAGRCGNREPYRCCPFTARKINSFRCPRWLQRERWLDARHDLISLPEIGHLPHEENREVVTTAIIDWLTAL